MTEAVDGDGVRAALHPLGRPIAAEMARDAPLYGLIGAYLVFAVALGAATGLGTNVAAYLPFWLLGLAAFWGGWTICVETPAAVRAAPASPLAALIGRLRARITPRFVAGTVLYLAISLFYGAFTIVKSALPALRPFAWDARLAELDAALHLGHDPWRLLFPILGHEPVTRVVEHLYSAVWANLLFIVPLLISTARRFDHLRLTFLVSLLLSWVILGNLAAGLWLSGGPVYYGAFTGDEARFSALVDYLAFSKGEPNSAAGLQAYLWDWFQQGQPGPGSGISAFPSIHVATVTLFALAAGRCSAWAGVFGWLFTGLILAGSVHLGWHYAVDGYVSILAVCAIWWAVSRLNDSRRFKLS